MGFLISALGNSSRALFQAVLGMPPGLRLIPGGRLSRLTSLLALFSRSDEAAESLLNEKFSSLQIQGDLTEYEAKALERLRDLMQLRLLAFGRTAEGKQRIRQGFVQRAARELDIADTDSAQFSFGTQDITEGATGVAQLYWKLFDSCRGSIPELRPVAMQLYYAVFGVPFSEVTAQLRITRLTDSIQRDAGVPFLVLNLIKQGALFEAREIGRHLLNEQVELEDEDLVNGLYWFTEIFWFQRAWASEKLTHETTLRFLYHLCFSQPDRGGFLEIDSQFFSEFEMVNELAREAFTYRETLVATFLRMWEAFDGEFDPFFQKNLESLVGGTSKIFDSRLSWEKLWKRSQETFSREYLHVVEGNLCYVAGQLEDAADCYETALKIDPDLRPALLNLLFVYARLGRRAEHARLADRLTTKRPLPSTWYAIGDSYLLAGDEATAEAYFEPLREVPGWELKLDYYKSTFCHQNGMHEAALRFALAAFAANPGDTTIAYHLSLCHNAVGNKDAALSILKAHGPSDRPSWLHFYRFTLERDLGHHMAASETLMEIPSEYFEDPEELEAALNYARGRQDLGLMRHLKKKH